MNSFDAKFFNKSLWKPKTNIKAVKPITPHFAKPATKGASLTMQKQWKSFSPQMKNTMRMKYPDRDGDRIPDRWDCNPYNPFKTKDMQVVDIDEQVNKPIQEKKTYDLEHYLEIENRFNDMQSEIQDLEDSDSPNRISKINELMPKYESLKKQLKQLSR